MYQDFLATKSKLAPPLGIKPKRPFPAIMKPFQADLTRWALKRGRAELKESYWRQAVKNCHDAEQTAKNGSLLDLMQTSEAAE